MQPQSRKIHVLQAPAPVEQSQNVAKLLDVLRCHPPGCPSIVESLETSMSERPDHRDIIICRVSLVN